MFSLRPYQPILAAQGCSILRRLGIVYYAVQVRVGKTHISFETARLYGAKKVLFLTKKKALSTKKEVGTIEVDYIEGGYEFELVIINNESLHKVTDNDFDLIISDEHHRNAAFPKVNITTDQIRKRFRKVPMIFLSGTPTPENPMQIFHQFWVSDFSPFRQYTTFYQWFTGVGGVKVSFDNGYGLVPDYANTNEGVYKFYAIEKRSIPKKNPDGTDNEAYQDHIAIIDKKQADAIAQVKKSTEYIDKVLEPYFVKFTQKEAGFTSSVKEHILQVEMKPVTYKLANQLKRHRVIEGKAEVILADTAAKLLSKLTQLFSGTVKFESGNAQTIDTTKAEFIKERFVGQKIGIFFKFKEEWQMLKEVFGETITDKLDVFNTTDKNFAVQIVSGREAISLRNAKYLVYFTPDYSALSYWQSRDRMTTRERSENEVFWVFSNRGVEAEIYKMVLMKKDFTVRYFEKWLEKQNDF